MNTLTAAKLKVGGKYNWIGQAERLHYLGQKAYGYTIWHQFAKIGQEVVWCEVLTNDLQMLEETKVEA